MRHRLEITGQEVTARMKRPSLLTIVAVRFLRLSTRLHNVRLSRDLITYTQPSLRG